MATDHHHLRQAEELMARLDRDHAARQRPEDRSPRTPNGIPKSMNVADRIEQQLRADGHRIWGFVVYRCTYGNTAAWEQCIQRIRASIGKAMDLYDGHDLLDEGCFALTVIADASTLDGASTWEVRRHFDDWCTRAIHEEQGSQDDIEARRQEPSLGDSLMPLRYSYCIQIDETSLQEILSEGRKGWVKLIKRNWQTREAAAQQREQQQQPEVHPAGGAEDGGNFTDDEDEDEEEYPAIEGCTEEDVGWIKVQVLSVMPDMYANLRDPNLWHIQYFRPPEMTS